jgi:hypothetical protein
MDTNNNAFRLDPRRVLTCGRGKLLPSRGIKLVGSKLKPAKAGASGKRGTPALDGFVASWPYKRLRTCLALVQMSSPRARNPGFLAFLVACSLPLYF